MLQIELSELWNSYRSTTGVADKSERDVDLAWSAFHGGVFALVRVLAQMDANGKGNAALWVIRWMSAELSAARATAPGRQREERAVSLQSLGAGTSDRSLSP